MAGISMIGKALVMPIIFLILTSNISLAADDNAAQGLNAAIIYDTIPSIMYPGQQVTVSVAVMNTGAGTWSESAMIRLGAVGDFAGDAAKFGPVRILLPAGVSVGPGEQYVFSFILTAPAQPGIYHPSYRMVWELHEWFGQSLDKTIDVQGLQQVDAIVVSNTIPSTMTGGMSYLVNITMRNNGTLTWNKTAMIRLGAVGDYIGDAYKFGPVRVLLPPGVNVTTGQSYTFMFTLTAPMISGTYQPAYRMVWDGHKWFGQQLTKQVEVSGVPPTVDALISSDTIPASMTAGQEYNVTITTRNIGSLPWNETAMIRLGAVGDHGGEAYLFGPVRLILPPGVEVTPGQDYSWAFTMTAPASPATYHPAYRMVWDGVKWFGETLTKDVNVTSPANTYYVSTMGSDLNPGTYEEPWASPGYGSRQLNPGDTLIILNGTYILSRFDEDIIEPTSGTADAWITIKGEDGKLPVLAGRDNLYSAAILNGVSYVRLENLEITHDASANGTGIYFRGGIEAVGAPCSYIVLKSLYIHHIDEGAVDIKDVHHMQVLDCMLEYTGFGGIAGPAGSAGGVRDLFVNNTTMSYSGHYYQGGNGSDDPYDRPDGYGIEHSAGPIEIAYCKAEHNKGDGLDSKSNDTSIHNCIVANNRCDGVKLWGNNSSVVNTLIYGTGDGVGGASPWAGIVISPQAPGDVYSIIDVTLQDNPTRYAYPMYVNYDSLIPMTLVMRNTIVANGYGLVYIGDSVTLQADHNDFYRPGEAEQVYANGREYTAAELESGMLGSGMISRDPLFMAPAWGTTGDYHLQAGSPCRGAGTSIGAPAIDLEGNPRPTGAGYDMGAYQSS